MSQAAVSLKWFSVYLMAAGLGLIVAPDLVFGLTGIPASHEVWPRVLGVAALNIGVYYLAAARADSRALFTASVYTRCFVLLSFTTLVLLGWAPTGLLLFGAADGAGGLWTWLALRRESRF